MGGVAKTSVAGRAALAVGLFIGFYLLALAIVIALLYLPYAEFVHANRVHLRLAFFCIVGAGIILWSVMPRRDRFLQPGPWMTAENQPELFAQLDAVARKMNETIPREVYLLPDCNAWVTERGGIMGVGGRRVMGIGLPLMQLLTVPQLQAVLAHEFGHFSHADTKLGPWVYKTRAAVMRTVKNLEQHSSILQLPFVWYAKIFLRVTQSVSRQQEYVADRSAAEAFGGDTMASALKIIHTAGPAYDAFWRHELEPVIRSGYLPGIMEGFAHFMRSDTIRANIDKILRQMLQTEETSPYDSHPSLSQRLAALAEPAEQTGAQKEPAADLSISLLSGAVKLERALLGRMVGERTLNQLQAIDWEVAPEKVILPAWRALVEKNAAVKDGFTMERIPSIIQSPVGFASGAVTEGVENGSAEAAKESVLRVVNSAAAVYLVDRGWSIVTRPGDPIRFERDGRTFDLFKSVAALNRGQITSDEWVTKCTDAGILEGKPRGTDG